MNEKLTLTKTKALIVEGKDEENFFIALFRHLGKEDVQIIDMVGKDSIKKYFSAVLLLDGFENVTAYALVADADSSHDDTFKSITGLLEKNMQPVPAKPNTHINNGEKQVGVFIMPGDLENGMLEDLCLKTVADHPAMPCLEKYFECLENSLLKKTKDENSDPKKYFFPENLSKAKAKAFLAALHEQKFSSVGVAALNGYWNFDHPSLQELKQFLLDL